MASAYSADLRWSAGISVVARGFRVIIAGMHLSRIALALWLVALAVAACGSSTGSNDDARGAQGAPIPAADFPALAAAAYCHSITHCCVNGSADCTTSVTTMIQSALAAGPPGTNVYDAVQARACVDAIDNLADSALCASWFMSTQRSLVACSEVMDGAVPVGGACSDNSVCKRGTLNGTLLGGFVSCLPFGGSSDNRCRAYAPTSTVGAACVDYQSDPTRGGALSDTTVNICAPGLECLNSACATAPAVGAACPNGVCADSYCGTAAVCVAFGQNGDDCSQGACVQGSSCNAGTCASDPPVPWILDVGFNSTTYLCPG